MDRRAALGDQRFHPVERRSRLHSTSARSSETSMSRWSPWAGAPRLVLAFVAAASLAGTVPAAAAALRSGPVSHGPWIDRTLSGGTARDLSIEELRVVNLARGIVFPR